VAVNKDGCERDKRERDNDQAGTQGALRTPIQFRLSYPVGKRVHAARVDKGGDERSDDEQLPAHRAKISFVTRKLGDCSRGLFREQRRSTTKHIIGERGDK
jgi:hypothetical protein